LKAEEAALQQMEEDDDLKVNAATLNQTQSLDAESTADWSTNEEVMHLVLDGFKAPEFVSSVPVFARYQCPECGELFGDKYRWKMHREWAHQTVVVAKGALRKRGILNHAQCEKPLKYACPYSGCLRGANSSDEIEDHILRHHDITDPTKPKVEADGGGGGGEKRKETQMKNENGEVDVIGVAYLSASAKRKISKVWHESKATRIDKENSINLIKNFVSAIVNDELDRFDETTKRLQRKYATDMEIIAANNQKEARLAQSSHVPRHDILPIPPQQLIVPE